MKKVRYIPTPFSYSSAVKAGDYVFLGLHRGVGDDIRTQINDSFLYVEKTVKEYNLSLKDIGRVNDWVRDTKELTDRENR